MSSTRKILHTFLASPGDLQDERKAVHDVVDAFNECWADEFGYQIELLGWEDTVAGVGRPQQIINREVDRCGLFIGLMWKRWGTPPDKDGKFSSGFHEEFERSMDRRERSGSPEIALFFKKIPDGYMEDPGDDLRRVLDFQNTIIAEKKLLFQKFSAIQDMEKLVWKCLAAHVIRVREADAASEPKEDAKPADSEPEKQEAEKQSSDSSPFSVEGFTFLKNFVDRIGREDALADLSAPDVARFRLLANSISMRGNQEMALGAHDINVLFSAYVEGMKLGETETRCLARLGFQHLSNENVPLWCWYSNLSHYQYHLDPAFVSSVVGANDDEKVGALSVLSALARELPTDENKKGILDYWFSEKSSVRVRSAALEYLTKMGAEEDYAVAKKEYDRSDSRTFRKALECMVSILLRTEERNSAQRLVLESQFESLDAGMLQAVLKGFENLETEALMLGLEHRNAQVRLQTLKVLLKRGVIDEERAQRLSGDTDASVRNEAVAALLKFGRSFTEEEVKEILVRPQQQPSHSLPGMIAGSGSDDRGEEFFARYQLESQKRSPEGELTRKVESSHMFDDTAYFVRVESYFAKHVKELRRDIDDTFKAYFEERLRRMESWLSLGKDFAEKLKNQYRDLEDFHRKQLTRRGLDILCRAGNREDLQRIRGNLQSGYAGASKEDARYLGKCGEWTDILLLSNVKVTMVSRTLTDHEDFQEEVAKAALTINSGHPVSALLSLELPAVLLKKTIEVCTESLTMPPLCPHL